MRQNRWRPRRRPGPRWGSSRLTTLPSTQVEPYDSRLQRSSRSAVPTLVFSSRGDDVKFGMEEPTKFHPDQFCSRAYGLKKLSSLKL